MEEARVHNDDIGWTAQVFASIALNDLNVAIALKGLSGTPDECPFAIDCHHPP